jgi:hypothetical protein
MRASSWRAMTRLMARAVTSSLSIGAGPGRRSAPGHDPHARKIKPLRGVCGAAGGQSSISIHTPPSAPTPERPLPAWSRCNKARRCDRPSLSRKRQNNAPIGLYRAYVFLRNYDACASLGARQSARKIFHVKINIEFDRLLLDFGFHGV